LHDTIEISGLNKSDALCVEALIERVHQPVAVPADEHMGLSGKPEYHLAGGR
jgi:hypothetical protein